MTVKAFPHRPRAGVRRGFSSILLPVNTAQPELPWDMIDLAARLATERRSAIVLLAFTEVPLWEEMDVELPEVEERVHEMARQARSIAGRYGVGVHVTAPRTRGAADLVLAEARRRRAELIVLGATGHRRGTVASLLSDPVARRVAEEPGLRTMFVKPPECAA
ncbi:MAG TPA: universal stress protein [Gaiellales bacterium]|nr:universal stress protein [Gaiellales bacterium]